VPQGANHNKPVYQKEGSGKVSVLIYFWDDRDGPSFSGWWFGPKVGGDQVWAYNGDTSAGVPPPGGWKVPWDGPVDDSFRITPQDSGKRSGDVPSGQPPSKQHRGEEDDRRRVYADRQRDDRHRDDRQRDEGRQRERDDRHKEDHRQREELRVREEREREKEEHRRREDEKRMEEERRRAEEARRRKEQERLRLAEEERKHREEEERRRQRAQREREEEERKRREEELRKRREEEETRRKEQAAALSVRKVIQRLRNAAPETFDALKEEVLQTQSDELKKMGSEGPKVRQEVENALKDAMERVEQIKEKREIEERRRAEEEKRRQEEQEKVKKLLEEADDVVKSVEEKADKFSEAIAPLENSPQESPESIRETADEVEKNAADTRDALEAAFSSLADKRQEMGRASEVGQVRRALGDLHAKLSAVRRTLEKATTTLEEVREKADRKAKALKRGKEQEDSFTQFDSSSTGILSREGVAKLAKSAYDFEPDAALLDKVMKYLAPITRENFIRARQMLAISKSEQRARVQRAEAAEQARLLEEKREAVKKLLDGVEEQLKVAAVGAVKAEDHARPLNARGADTTTSTEMRATGAEALALVEPIEADIGKVLAILSEVEEQCAGSDSLQSFMKWDVPHFQKEHDRVQEKLKEVRLTVKESEEKATRKEYVELDQSEKDVASALRAFMDGEGKTADELFSHIVGEAESIAKAKFLDFVKGLKDMKLSEALLEKAISHIIGEGKDVLEKAQLKEIVRLYYKCVKGTVMTESISIKSKTVRRLEVNEVLEILEGPKKEDGANVMRVKCLAVMDDLLGWVTVVGNQGTPLLIPGGNLLTCVKETVITDGLSVQDSKTVRRLAKGEVIEVLEFPKKDPSISCVRIRGKAKIDGTTGWITVEGNQGTAFLEPG